MESCVDEVAPGSLSCDVFSRDDVQAGHFFALIGICEQQNGHSLVVGCDGGEFARHYVRTAHWLADLVWLGQTRMASFA